MPRRETVDARSAAAEPACCVTQRIGIQTFTITTPVRWPTAAKSGQLSCLTEGSGAPSQRKYHRHVSDPHDEAALDKETYGAHMIQAKPKWTVIF